MSQKKMAIDFGVSDKVVPGMRGPKSFESFFFVNFAVRSFRRTLASPCRSNRILVLGAA